MTRPLSLSPPKGKRYSLKLSISTPSSYQKTDVSDILMPICNMVESKDGEWVKFDEIDIALNNSAYEEFYRAQLKKAVQEFRKQFDEMFAKILRDVGEDTK